MDAERIIDEKWTRMEMGELPPPPVPKQEEDPHTRLVDGIMLAIELLSALKAGITWNFVKRLVLGGILKLLQHRLDKATEKKVVEKKTIVSPDDMHDFCKDHPETWREIR